MMLGRSGSRGAAGSSSGGGGLTHIETQTLGSDTAAVTFSAIAGTYRHLRILGQVQGNRGSSPDVLRIGFNGVTTDLRSYIGNFAGTTGTSTYSGGFQYTGEILYVAGSGAGVFTAVAIDIINYASTALRKGVIAHAVEPEHSVTFGGARWSPGTPVAITSVKLDVSIGTLLKSGTTFSLYGVS